MNLWPVVDRELRVLARRRSMYMMRGVAALVAVALWATMVASRPAYMKTSQLALQTFMFLGFVSLVFCLLAGLFLTADCISEEKREGTLGLLFLTDLSGWDVVLGKLSATSWNAIYGLLGTFPILSMCLLMGGVTGGEFFRVTLVLLLGLGLSLAIGMVVSVHAWDARQALLGTLGIILLQAAGLPLLWWLIAWIGRHYSMHHLLLWPSPGYAFFTAVDRVYMSSTGAENFWASCLVISATILAAFGYASWKLPSKREQSEPVASVKSRASKGSYRRGSAALQYTLKTREMEDHPFAWLMLRDRLSPAILSWVLRFFIPVWFLFYLLAFVSPKDPEAMFVVCMFTTYGLHVFFKIMVTSEASRLLVESRASGALELVLATPLRPDKIVADLWRALGQIFRTPIKWLLLQNGLLILIMFANPGHLHFSSSDRGVFLELFIGSAFFLAMDSWALSWVAIGSALRARWHHRAILAAFGRIMLPLWLILVLIIFRGRFNSANQAAAIFGLWMLAALINNLWQGLQMSHYVQNHFRQAAAPSGA